MWQYNDVTRPWFLHFLVQTLITPTLATYRFPFLNNPVIKNKTWNNLWKLIYCWNGNRKKHCLAFDFRLWHLTTSVEVTLELQSCRPLGPTLAICVVLNSTNLDKNNKNYFELFLDHLILHLEPPEASRCGWLSSSLSGTTLADYFELIFYKNFTKHFNNVLQSSTVLF